MSGFRTLRSIPRSSGAWRGFDRKRLTASISRPRRTAARGGLPSGCSRTGGAGSCGSTGGSHYPGISRIRALSREMSVFPLSRPQASWLRSGGIGSWCPSPADSWITGLNATKGTARASTMNVSGASGHLGCIAVRFWRKSFVFDTIRMMLVGNERNQQYLLRAMNAGVLAHAYLLSGPASVGKRTLALAVAGRLLCESPNIKRLDACGACRACELARAGTHPDIVFLSRESRLATDAEKRGPPAGRAGIGIGDIHELRERVSRTPWSGKRIIAVIDGVEALSPAAKTALS